MSRLVLISIAALALVVQLEAQVVCGADLLLLNNQHLINGKRVGLVTNHTAVLANGKHLADAIAALKNVTLVALFGPEHGIRGDAPDGRMVAHGIDPQTGVPVYSLYGTTTKPTDEMLKGIDVLLFDIQDVGVRFYTYETTLALTMEAAAERKIPFIVLDRPNPIRGVWVEGFVRIDSAKSFVGWNPTPIAHGMTMGELAAMINGEHWLKDSVRADLSVVCVSNWKRDIWQDAWGLPWIKPSPNMVSLKTATVYPGTCLFEGTNLSEGRGTSRPFEYIGAPFVDGQVWADMLNALHLPGVEFQAVEFVPEDIPRVASNPKYRGEKCGGVFIHVFDRDAFKPVSTAVYMLASARHLLGVKFQWKTAGIDRLAGTPLLRVMIEQGETPERIIARWSNEVEKFKKVREKYLLYD